MGSGSESFKESSFERELKHQPMKSGIPVLCSFPDRWSRHRTHTQSWATREVSSSICSNKCILEAAGFQQEAAKS